MRPPLGLEWPPRASLQAIGFLEMLHMCEKSLFWCPSPQFNCRTETKGCGVTPSIFFKFALGYILSKLLVFLFIVLVSCGVLFVLIFLALLVLCLLVLNFITDNKPTRRGEGKGDIIGGATGAMAAEQRIGRKRHLVGVGGRRRHKELVAGAGLGEISREVTIEIVLLLDFEN